MSEQKSFFELLSPRSAALVGLVTGVLVLGTIGFVVLGIMALKGGVNFSTSAKTNNSGQIAANNPAPAPAPVINAPKSDKPKVELFVMSYCPYGLQMEKAYLPALNLLKNKADMSIKFVSYAMHGLKEVEENTRQYCIQGEQADKYSAYLNCFVLKDDYKSCLSAAGVNEGKMNTCVDKANKQFGVMDKYNDKTTWLSGQYPIYPINGDLNEKYGVQGSPTLVINGAQVESGRTPDAVKQAICATFNNAPSECSQTLSTSAATPGFGAGVGQDTAGAACGN